MIKLVIFDFDGTMFHTAPEIHRAINLTLKEFNHSELSYEEVKHCIGLGLLHLLKTIKPEIDRSPEALKKLGEVFRTHYEKILLESKPFPGLWEFLTTYKNQVAVASNKDKKYVKLCLEKEPWSQINWTALYGGNSFPTKKPEPEMITNLLNLANCAPHEAVIVGDGTPDIEVAKRTGIHSIAVSYGYSPIKELMELGASKKIDNLNELTQTLSAL